MEIKSEMVKGVSVLELNGRFDAHEVAPVMEWFKSSLEAQNPHLIVDLQGVNFLDSTALATLVQGLKRTRERGGILRLCGFQQAVRIIFELTRLDKAFDIDPTLEESIRHLTE